MQVGSLVECIDDNFNQPNTDHITMPLKGSLYFIVGMKEWPRGIGVYLSEYEHIKIKILHSNGRITIEAPPFNIKHFAEILAPPAIKEESVNELHILTTNICQQKNQL